MNNNYIKLNSGDIVQIDDIIHISKPFYPTGKTIAFSILYAGKERIVIEYPHGICNHKPCTDMEKDLNLIYKKIGISC